MKLYFLGLLVGIGLATAACSPPNRFFPGAPFPTSRSITCSVKAVHSGILNPTYYRSRPKDSLKLTFKDMNDEDGTATLVGNNGSETVEYRASDRQWHFIETTPSGNLTTTTVFAPPERGEPMPSVHSRHIEVAAANIVITQYAGSCVAS